MNTIERVARAIYENERPRHHGDWSVFCRVEGNAEFMAGVAEAAIAAHLAALADEGMVVVPREPTPAQKGAFFKFLHEARNPLDPMWARHIYYAMINAAPKEDDEK